MNECSSDTSSMVNQSLIFISEDNLPPPSSLFLLSFSFSRIQIPLPLVREAVLHSFLSLLPPSWSMYASILHHRLKHSALPLSVAMPAAVHEFPAGPLTPPDAAETAPNGSSVKDATLSSLVTAIHVISTERAALAHLEQLYQSDGLAQESLVRAVNQIVRTIQDGGKLVLCGVGKSGKIARKVEATMNSLGVYSIFLHPTEALHGDLGMVREVCSP